MAKKETPTAFSLIYVSKQTARDTHEAATRGMLVSIQKTAQAHNSQKSIRGVLLFAAGHFMQWLEGAEASVRALMARIATDPRHEDIQVIYTGTGPAQLSQWSMSLVVRADAQTTVLRQLQLLRAGELPRTRNASMPAAIVASLVKPLERIGRERSRRKILLYGQTGVWPAALLSSLSASWKRPTAHTRLVGSHGLAREAVVEYLDYTHPNLGRLRLVNFLGDVAGMPWLAEVRGKLAASVLFYSVNSPEAVTVFSETALAQMGPTNRFSPVLCLFGRTAAPLMDPVQDWFTTQGRPVSAARMSLTDSQGVWTAIEALLSASQSHSTEFAPTGWKPSSAASTVTVLPRPMPDVELSFDLDEGPTPPASVAEPSASDAAPLPSITESGKQWLAALLELDAVQAVGAQCGLNGPQSTIVGHFKGLSTEQKQAQGETFKAWLTSEAAIHLQLAANLSAPDVQNVLPGSQQMLTRFAKSFCVSCTVPGPQVTTVLVQFASGYVNQGMAQSQLNACLRQLQGPLFA